MNYEDILNQVKDKTSIARRTSWDADIFIFCQIPADIKEDIIPKMISLPDVVKSYIKDYKEIHYINQICIFNKGFITYYTPSGDDIFANDWITICEQEDSNNQINVSKNINNYQKFTATTDIYPNDAFNIGYKALGLVGEAGETADKIKKIYRDKNGIFNATDEMEIAKELGDCLWYISRLTEALGFNMSDIININVDKLTKRKAENKIHGNGDNR